MLERRLIASGCRLSGLIVGLFLCGWPGGTALAQQVSHPTLGYSFTVPPGFVEAPEISATNPKFSHAFRKPLPADPLGVMLIIERLGGRIGGERLKQSHLPPGLNATVQVMKWQGVDIDVVEFTESSALGPYFNINAQIPLKREAIQLKIAAKAAHSPEVRATLAHMLTSFKGETNLIPGAIPGIASSPHYPAMLVGASLLTLVVGLAVLWGLSRSGERGQALAVAMMMWIGGGAISALRIRELMVIGGSLALTGVIGMLALFFGWVFRKVAAGFSGGGAKKKKKAAPVKTRRRVQYDEYGNVIED